MPRNFPPAAWAFPGTKNAAIRWSGNSPASHGAKVPARLVSSAKSWLCHAGVDRTSAILPWQAPPDVQRVSPLDASARFLSHFREAWDHAFKEAAFKEQEILITVPASFDAAARELL